MKTEDILKELTRFDTPTICNAIEFVLGGRQGEGFTERPIVAAHPNLPPVVGYVATARVRARAPSKKSAAEAKAARIGYYEYIAKAPKPCIVAIQDLDEPAGHGAFWGEVQVTVHKGLGIAGGITSGSIRDLDVIDPWFPLMAGCVSPSKRCSVSSIPSRSADMPDRHSTSRTRSETSPSHNSCALMFTHTLPAPSRE